MPNERLSKSEILDSSDIRSLFVSGKKTGDKNVLLVYKKQDSSDSATIRDHNKLGIAVSSKVVKKAVQRNRIKRLYREVFRKNKHLFPAPYHYLFVKRTYTDDASYESTLQEIKHALNKAQGNT